MGFLDGLFAKDTCPCGREVSAKGLCERCYNREWRKRNKGYLSAWFKKHGGQYSYVQNLAVRKLRAE